MLHHRMLLQRLVFLALTYEPSILAFEAIIISHRHKHSGYLYAHTTRLSSPLSVPLRSAPRFLSSRRLDAKKSRDDDSNNEISKEMEDAFRQLENLKSLNDDDDDDVALSPNKKKKQDEAFARAMQELDLKDIIQDVSPTTPESEAKLYKDMISEIDETPEIDLISNVKSELGGRPTNIPKFDPTTRDTEKFMEKALEAALEEVEKRSDVDINKESLLDNKEIMKEIEKIFDKASNELLEGIQEIRDEQWALAKESAERNSKESSKRIEQDEQRLALAEENMKKMLAKVNEETKNVQAAIDDLKKAQEEMEGGVDSQLSSLKGGGIVKQATLVGTVLFAFRSLGDGLAYMGGDSTHLMPATVQAAIAVVCLLAFLFS